MGRRRVPSFFGVFSGFNAPGLINPFEVVDVHRVRRAADHEVAVGAGRAGDDDAVFARGTGLRVVEIELSVISVIRSPAVERSMNSEPQAMILPSSVAVVSVGSQVPVGAPVPEATR